jgi:hypothetical protein
MKSVYILFHLSVSLPFIYTLMYLLFVFIYLYTHVLYTHIYTTVVTKILPVIVIPGNSVSHTESENFTTFFISALYDVNYTNMIMTAKSWQLADQTLKICDICRGFG